MSTGQEIPNKELTSIHTLRDVLTTLQRLDQEAKAQSENPKGHVVAEWFDKNKSTAWAAEMARRAAANGEETQNVSNSKIAKQLTPLMLQLRPSGPSPSIEAEKNEAAWRHVVVNATDEQRAYYHKMDDRQRAELIEVTRAQMEENHENS